LLGASNLQKRWTLTVRFIDTKLSRPRWRWTLDYRVNRKLLVGVEWNPAAKEFNPLRLTYDLTSETKTTPLISLGTSSDRVGSPEGTQMYYLTVAKTLPQTQLAPYVSLAYSEWDDGFNVPFGVYWHINPHWNLLAMNDGRQSHLLLTHQWRDGWITVGWIWLKRFSVSIGWGF
jgi:hypothetical protein